MDWNRRAGHGAIVAFLALIAVACSDDEPAGPAGAIQMAVDPGSISVPQGGSGSTTVALTRIGGFGSAVTLAAAGLPAGVTVTFTPAQLTGTTASAEVTVSAAETVTLGTYSATISGTAPGVDAVTVAFGLTVTAPPDFALAVDPTAITVVAGTSGNAEVIIERTNFTGAVALALGNPPAGITAAFDPTPATGDASALVVSVAASVPAGNYPLTIEGTATGPGARSTALQVTVPAPPTGGNVEYLFCDVAASPTFFAYQDGDGAWQAVTGVTSGGATRFAFNLAQGHGGVLQVYQEGAAAIVRAASRPAHVRQLAARVDGHRTQVAYASTAELAQDGFNSCAQDPPTKTVTGTVTNVSAGAYGIVSLGGVINIFDGAVATNPRTFNDVPGGPVDLVGSRTTPGNLPDRVILVRNLNIPDQGSLPAAIDFNGPASLAPATATATISGGAGDDLEVFVDLVTANREVGLWFDLSPSQTATRPWAGFPQSALTTGDFHGLIVFASANNGSGDFRVSTRYVGPVADQTIAMGPIMAAPTVSQVAAGSYPRFRFQGTLAAEYDKGATVDLLGVEGAGNIYSIIATNAWLAARGNPLAYDFTMPDVAGIAGFPLASRLPAGTNDMSVSGFGFTGAGTFDLRPSVGSEARSAVRNGTIVVP